MEVKTITRYDVSEIFCTTRDLAWATGYAFGLAKTYDEGWWNIDSADMISKVEKSFDDLYAKGLVTFRDYFCAQQYALNKVYLERIFQMNNVDGCKFRETINFGAYYIDVPAGDLPEFAIDTKYTGDLNNKDTINELKQKAKDARAYWELYLKFCKLDHDCAAALEEVKNEYHWEECHLNNDFLPVKTLIDSRANIDKYYNIIKEEPAVLSEMIFNDEFERLMSFDATRLAREWHELEYVFHVLDNAYERYQRHKEIEKHR